jgi:hypothetical protein
MFPSVMDQPQQYLQSGGILAISRMTEKNVPTEYSN